MRPKLGQLLVDAGALTEGQVGIALAYHARRGCKLGQAVVELRMLGEAQMLAALGRHLGVEVVEREVLDTTPATLVRSVPARVLRRLQVCPIACEFRRAQRVLVVATSQAEDLPFLEELAFLTGCEIRPVLAAASAIAQALVRHGVQGAGHVEALELPDEEPAGAFVILRNHLAAYV